MKCAARDWLQECLDPKPRQDKSIAGRAVESGLSSTHWWRCRVEATCNTSKVSVPSHSCLGPQRHVPFYRRAPHIQTLCPRRESSSCQVSLKLGHLYQEAMESVCEGCKCTAEKLSYIAASRDVSAPVTQMALMHPSPIRPVLKMEDSEMRNNALRLSTAHGVCGNYGPKASDLADGESRQRPGYPRCELCCVERCGKEISFIQSLCDVVLRENGASYGK